MLIAAKFLDRVAFVSLHIFLQNLISVDFIKEYQVTIVFAVLFCKKKIFYVSVAARQVHAAYYNVKIQQKGSSLYHNDTRKSFDFSQRLSNRIYRRRINLNTLILHMI